MAQNISLWNAVYSNVPQVLLPKQGGGTAAFTDTSPTTATDADVTSGKIYFKADGTQSTGTGSGGGNGDYTRTEVCPSTTFSVASAGSYTALTNSGRLTVGADYIITYDGTEYVFTCEELYGSSTDRFVGDYRFAWGATSDLRYPFCIEDWDGNNEPVVYALDTSSHTIKIELLTLLNDGVSLKSKSITANGTYDPANDNADGYSSVTVNVPNSFAAGDEGKVVKNGALVSQTSATYTSNNTYDTTTINSVTVNVGGGSGMTLIGTLSVGSVSTSSTSDTDTGKSITVKGIYDYDLLVCQCSVGTKTNGRHVVTTRLCWLTASSNIATKNGATFATATWNVKLSSSGTATARSSTTAYGVYAKAATVSAGSTGDNGQAVITIYQRYNSTQTGTINGTYTMRVYGVKLYDLLS